jgi:hypothetical protein
MRGIASSLGQHPGSPKGGGNSPFLFGRAYIMGILVAVVVAIGGMALALHIYNNWRLWQFLNEKKRR